MEVKTSSSKDHGMLATFDDNSESEEEEDEEEVNDTFTYLQ